MQGLNLLYDSSGCPCGKLQLVLNQRPLGAAGVDVRELVSEVILLHLKLIITVMVNLQFNLK